MSFQGGTLPTNLDTKAAAVWLAVEAPDRTAKQWATWLLHNRTPTRRTAWHMPFLKIGARVLYDTEDLHRLARLSNVAAGKAKVDTEDAAWIQALTSKTKLTA